MDGWGHRQTGVQKQKIDEQIDTQTYLFSSLLAQCEYPSIGIKM